MTAALILLTSFLVLSLVNLAFADRLSRPPRTTKRDRDPGDPPLPPETTRPLKVSILIPARNEERNLRRTLPVLLASERSRTVDGTSEFDEGANRNAREPGLDIEVIVLDDESTDQTARVASELGARVVRGAPLPKGWLGKNWACHQLAELASGDVLIFVDADVLVHSNAIRDTAQWISSGTRDVVTALPRQEMGSWSESAVLPFVMHLPILCTLPLPLVARTPNPSLSAANGQWLAFSRSAYDRLDAHQTVRDSLLEDVEIGRLAKRKGLRLGVTLAADSIEVRMYEGFSELRRGFGKNLYLLVGGSIVSAAAAAAVHVVAFVVPWFSLVFVESKGAAILAAINLVLLLALRGATAVAFRSTAKSVILHPLGSLLTLWLLAESAWRHLRGRLTWKGRSIARA